MDTLRKAWDDIADGWLDWARTPGHDHYFWRMNWPAFTALLPAPGRATLDLGCGEGRGGRALGALGHTVTGVDGSPRMVALAREAGGFADVLEADAAALPFADGSFDLVVAFMTLQDIDDAAGAVREAARVLGSGGRLCAAIPHPYTSGVRDDGAYFDERRYSFSVEEGGRAMTFHCAHRTIETYVAMLRDAGFALADLREPQPSPEHLADRREELGNADRWPLYLHLAAVVA